MHMRVVRVVLVAIGAAVAVLASSAGAANAQTDQASSVLSPVSWPTAEVLSRCHAVVETAIADYEAITASFGSASNGLLEWQMQSDAPMPVATYEAKLCSWVDANGDERIDIAEEPSVRAFLGPLGWAAGTTRSAARVGADGLVGRVCARFWIYASYPDGGRSSKRSSVGCTDNASVGPPAAVPDTYQVVLLGGSALGLFAVAAWVLPERRRLAILHRR
jgi:hypothetical protein